MADINKLFQCYLEHQNDMVKQYAGKYLVITADGVEGAYDTMREGYDKAIETYGNGNFILQLCTEGDAAYSQEFFTSRVAFI